MARKKNSSAGNVDAYVGYRIKLKRAELSLTQEDLANAIGVSFQQIQKYESGANRIAPARMLEISRKLKVPVSYFFSGIDCLQQNVGFLQEPTTATKSKDDKKSKEQKHLFELIEAFEKITSQNLREQVLSLTKALAGKNS
jgi:transcriptional regulator with XRE-family HTH domain